MKNKFLIVPYLLFAIAIGMLAYRHFVLKAEFLPVITNDTWKLEVTVDAEELASNKVIKLNIPSTLSKARIIQEGYSQTVQGMTVYESNGIRTLVWSNRGVENSIPEKAFNYSVVLQQGTSGIEIPSNLSQLSVDLVADFPDYQPELLTKYIREIKQAKKNVALELGECFAKSKCLESNTGITKSISIRKKAILLVNVLRQNNFKAAIARGFYPEKPTKDTNFIYWVRAEKEQKTYNVFLDSEISNGQQVLFWDFLDELNQISNPVNMHYSMLPDENYNFLKPQKEVLHSKFFDLISLHDLPASVQVVYRVMLLIPLGALIVAFTRIIIGVSAFGTFMSVLVALSFNQVGLKVGLSLLLIMIVAGLIFRGLMSKMRLLSVARISCTLIFVIMSIAVISKISWNFNLVEGFSATLFPIIVISMIIERMSIMIEEAGIKPTIKNLINTIIMSSIIHLIMTTKIVQYWSFSFWEMHIVIMGLLMLIGRYNGYRLSELFRFRNLVNK